MMKAVVEAEAVEVETTKIGRVDEEEVAERPNTPHGEVVPTPRAPLKEEAVVEVERMKPAVREPTLSLAMVLPFARRMFANREVVVALVPVALTNVSPWKDEATDEVAVILPTVRLPMVDEETISPEYKSSGDEVAE